MITAFAPGKLIVSGEHAVVYGHRALAVAVNLGTTVTVKPRAGPLTLDTTLDDPRLRGVVAELFPEGGLDVSIRSTLPIGRGMGSSASLAVALVRAAAQLDGRTASFDECFERGFAIERAFHGKPSGIDHATSAAGTGLLYDPKGPTFEPLVIGDLRAVVFDSGRAGDTAALVARVAAGHPANSAVIEAIGALTERIVAAIAADEPWVPLLDDNHELLKELGVSTPLLDDIVALARQCGAHAKLSGAGGGGVVLAVTDDPERLVARAAERGLRAFEVALP